MPAARDLDGLLVSGGRRLCALAKQGSLPGTANNRGFHCQLT